MWRETCAHSLQGVRGNISIHSLRVEGDCSNCGKSIAVRYFNPLPPCGGRPCQRATPSLLDYFNPLPPCGGRPFYFSVGLIIYDISIHSRRVEGDLKQTFLPLLDLGFQSTPSVWRETILLYVLYCAERISIHSLRVEGDLCSRFLPPRSINYFNPLPPCGGRHASVTGRSYSPHFNPLPPCGGRLYK